MRQLRLICWTLITALGSISFPLAQTLNYRWDINKLYQYQVEVQSDQWIDFSKIAELMKEETDAQATAPTGGRQRYEFAFKATLEVAPLNQMSANRWLLTYRWRKVSANLKIDNQPLSTEESKQFARLFEQTIVFVETDRRGKIERVWFKGADSNAPSRAILRAIVARMQVVMPAQSQMTTVHRKGPGFSKHNHPPPGGPGPQ